MKPIKLTHTEYLHLIFQTFTTEKGKLLLEAWESQFLFRKIANEGDDLLTIGIHQGEASFVLSILNLIEQENTNNNKD